MPALGPVSEAATAPEYRLWSIDDCHPAMMRVKVDATRGCPGALGRSRSRIVVAILMSEPAGLSIGKAMLADGREVPGVLGEPWLCADRAGDHGPSVAGAPTSPH